jgi:drug/metabolite transporter (DMT)-like permease
MFAAILTTFFFALSAILARRSIGYIGPQRANFSRQIMALVLLGLWAHTWGEGFHGATFGILFLSGVLGFGMGDWALFEALPRIGSGLTVLLCQCLAAPIAALTEWLWLGTGMTGIQVASSALILLGVALAVAPGKRDAIPAGHRLAGFGFGMISATGQAWGAVLSRYAFQRAQENGFMLDGITAAYQRLWGGALSIGLLLLVGGLHARWRPARRAAAVPQWRRAWPWVAANALVGATLGVSCYQWALKSAPSSIVLPIVATTPLMAMLLAFGLEGIRPTRRALAGAVVAVTGVVMLVRSSS